MSLQRDCGAALSQVRFQVSLEGKVAGSSLHSWPGAAHGPGTLTICVCFGHDTLLWNLVSSLGRIQSHNDFSVTLF